MKTSLYTFIMDYQGGTYISQCQAAGIMDAANKYAEIIIPHEHVPGKLFSRAIKRYLKDFPPFPLDGLTGVWIINPVVRNEMAFVNIVRTKR